MIDVPLIIAFRNCITHRYDAIDVLAVWDIIQQKLQKLEVSHLLDA